MLSKSIEKYANSLKQKKHRLEYKRFIAEGEKAFKELISSDIFIEKIIALPEWIDAHDTELRKFRNVLIPINEREMKRISSLVKPSAVFLIAQIPEWIPDEKNIYSNLNLVIDNVQDPGNMGTIVRIADWFGIPNIFCSEDSADPYHPKVIQSTMGSIARIKIFETNLTELFHSFSSITVYGTMKDGDNIYKAKLKDHGFILIGNEARGISDSLLPFIHKRISIPRFGKAESLNAAVATAIVCSEFRRIA